MMPWYFALAWFAAFSWPTLLIGGLFYWAGVKAKHHKIGKWLRLSAVICSIVLCLSFAVFAISIGSCSTSAFNSFYNCAFIPDRLASMSIPVSIFGIVISAIYAVCLSLCCGFVEWKHRKRIASAEITR